MHRAGISIEEVPYCFSRSSVKFQGHTALKIAEFDPDWAFPDCNSSLNSPMATKWCTKLEVALKRCPILFSRSYVKFQGHTALKIVEFDPNWAFPDSISSLNSPMAMKCCTKLETAKESCPIVFQGHPSNFKVTRDKTSLILTQIGRFRTIGRSQLSNPSDLPCLTEWGRVTHICVVELGHHWFRYWIVACSALSHYLNQCWNIVNWTSRNKLQWKFNRNSNIFIHENTFENVGCETAAILSRPQCVAELFLSGSFCCLFPRQEVCCI